MINRLKAKAGEEKRPTLLVDGGSLFLPADGGAEGEDIIESVTARAYYWDNFEVIAKSYAIMGYQALVPGRGDLLLGQSFFAEKSLQQLPLIAANVVYNGALVFPASTIVNLPLDGFKKEVEDGKGNANSVQVGLLGFVGGVNEKVGEYQLLSWQESLGVPLQKLKEKVGDDGLIVLLSAADISVNEEIAKNNKDIDIIIGGDATPGNVLRMFSPQTIFSQTTSRGASLGELCISLPNPTAKDWKDLDNYDPSELRVSLIETRANIVTLQNKLQKESSAKKRRRLQHSLQQHRRLVDLLQKQIVQATENIKLLEKGAVNGFTIQFHDIQPDSGDQRIMELMESIE